MNEYDDEKYIDYDDYKTKIPEYEIEIDDASDVIQRIHDGEILSF